MDPRHFDALAKQVGSRRTAVGALLTGLLLPFGAAARNRGKARKHRHRKDKGKQRKPATAQAEPCWREGVCTPKKGSNVSRCDLADYSAPDGLDCTRCNLSRANLSGTDLTGVNFTRANLSYACLVDADFTDATFTNSTNLYYATFCRTIMPDGSVNDSGCDAGSTCCPTCIAPGDACGAGIAGSCCGGTCANGVCRTVCTPATCQSLGKTCGAWPDGCGVNLNCGTCTPGTCQTATCNNGTCTTAHITGAQGPNCTGSGQLCCKGSCRGTLDDRFNCGGCGNVCFLPNEACLNGTCGCPPDSQTCPSRCKFFCSSDPDYYRDRFQDCFANDPTRQGNCAACISWADCYGPLDTGTTCGTVTGTCT